MKANSEAGPSPGSGPGFLHSPSKWKALLWGPSPLLSPSPLFPALHTLTIKLQPDARTKSLLPPIQMLPDTRFSAVANCEGPLADGGA